LNQPQAWIWVLQPLKALAQDPVGIDESVFSWQVTTKTKQLKARLTFFPNKGLFLSGVGSPINRLQREKSHIKQGSKLTTSWSHTLSGIVAHFAD